MAGGQGDTWTGSVSNGVQGGTDHEMNLPLSYSITSGTGASGFFSNFTSTWTSSNTLVTGQMDLNGQSVDFTSGKVSKDQKAVLKGTEGATGPAVTATLVATNGTSLNPQVSAGTFDADVLIKVW